MILSSRANLVTFACLALALACLAASSSHAAESSSSSSSGGGGTSNNHSHKSSSSTTATQARQSPMSMAASVVGALGSLVPGIITNVAPLVLLFGIGALMMPSLGLSAMGLLGRRSANEGGMPGVHGFPQASNAGNPFAQLGVRPIQTSPQDFYYFTKRSLASLPSFNSAPLFELLDRVARAIDNADKRYN